MKLYDAPVAPNPRRVRWVMAEKGINDIEVVPVSIPDGEHKQPAYLAKAGLPNLPMLEMDDGTTITESLAICRYLESVYPEPNMFGRDAKEAAVIEMWTRRAEMLVGNPLMQAVRHGHPALAALASRTVVDIALPWRRGAAPLAKIPLVGWVYLEREVVYPARWIEGARESRRRYSTLRQIGAGTRPALARSRR